MSICTNTLLLIQKAVHVQCTTIDFCYDIMLLHGFACIIIALESFTLSRLLIKFILTIWCDLYTCTYYHSLTSCYLSTGLCPDDTRLECQSFDCPGSRRGRSNCEYDSFLRKHLCTPSCANDPHRDPCTCLGKCVSVVVFLCYQVRVLAIHCLATVSMNSQTV